MEYSRNSNNKKSLQKNMNTELFDREMGNVSYQHRYMNPVNRMQIERDEFMRNSLDNGDSDEFDKRMPSRQGYDINVPIYETEIFGRTSKHIAPHNPYTNFADVNSDTKLSDNVHTKITCINGINNYGFFLFDNMLDIMKSAFIFSPYLIYTIFASLFIASDGNTEIELKNYFNYQRSDLLSVGLQDIKTNIKTLGNCIIFSDEIEYNSDFCKNVNMFTKIRKINTNNYLNETEDINNIIYKLSNLSKKSINSDIIKNTSVTLLNYGYINPTWTSYFSKCVTHNNIEYAVAINQMFGYYEQSNLQVLEIKSTDNICFGIIYGDIELNDKTYKMIESNLKPTLLGEVRIPKFSLTTKLKFANLLKETDLKTVFMDLKCPQLFNSECEITECLQNLEFHFTEKSVNSTHNSLKSHKKFIVEKSFRFYVRTTENVILLLGSY